MTKPVRTTATRAAAAFALAALVISGCSSTATGDGTGSSGSGSGPSVSPSDADALSAVLVIPGSTRVTGTPPRQGGGTGPAPTVTAGTSISATAGKQFVVTLQYTSQSGYRDCYVQVPGARDYFRIPGSESAPSGTIQIPVNIPSSVASGGFGLYTCIAGGNGAVSNPIDSRVSVTNPGTGSSSSGGSSSGGAAGETCSTSPSSNGCTLKYCVGPGGNTGCYYEVSGQRINCDCNNINPCAQTAGERLAACNK